MFNFNTILSMEKIKKLEDYENYAAGLKKQCEEEKKKLVRCAKELSAARKEQAQILEKEICKGLQELNFADVNSKFILRHCRNVVLQE